MSIEIKFSPYALQNNETLIQRIQFVYSPLNELFRSLHVLLNPRHHGMNIDWALTTKQQLSNKFLNDLQYFSLFYELGVPPILLNNFENLSSNLDTEIKELEKYLFSIDPQVILNSLEKIANDRESQFIPTLAKSLEWQDYTPTFSTNLLDDLAHEPQKVYQHLLIFIKDYRQQIFDYTWQEKNLDHFLLNEIKQQSIYLKQSGFVNLIDHLQIDRMYWQQKQLVIIKPFNQTIQLNNEDTILLVPSYFVWPHLFVDQFKYGIVLCYDALNKIQAKISPQHLANILNALGDSIRLKIIKYLAEQPCTTQALGQILTMSDSTVSHHLKLLKEAGLVTTHKKGKFVLYSPTNVISDLIPEFYNFLDEKNFNG
ncbi:MAG: metalloregulator ArsR/SmtB family transcription factor [Liquorilactobacillus hordei]|uniref:ArsR/SmtB family transcription factor n=1 Tax=Liquorilactobacillus hordei TaxID=468911 RepID=UPI0039E887C0